MLLKTFRKSLFLCLYFQICIHLVIEYSCLRYRTGAYDHVKQRWILASWYRYNSYLIPPRYTTLGVTVFISCVLALPVHDVIQLSLPPPKKKVRQKPFR